jgi:hypothetical protein
MIKITQKIKFTDSVGRKFPSYMGQAYCNHLTSEIVLVITPFNVLVSLIRNLYISIFMYIKRPRLSKNTEQRNREYEIYMAGYNDATNHINGVYGGKQ